MSQNLKISLENNIIYQWENWEIILKWDVKADTIWASQSQMAEIFWVNSQAVTKHIQNIYAEWELKEIWTCSKIEQVQKEWKRNVTRQVQHYNLDVLIAVGYRINSVIWTKFRKWANSILKQYITEWIAVNNSLFKENTQKFEQALEYLNTLTPATLSKLESWEIINLIQNYAQTWLSLDNFDKQNFPTDGKSAEKIMLSSEELSADIEKLKSELLKKWEATELFAQEKSTWNFKWIFWNIFQWFAWQDLYPSLEEKAAHLLYFIVKNHPFTDGNKRSWAFSFIWFLQKSDYNTLDRISPETLTTLTLLIAQSDPKEKEKMIGLVLLLLQ